MKLLSAKTPVKMMFTIKPLLEDQSFIHHYEYDHPSIMVTVCLPELYPIRIPTFFFDTSHRRVYEGSNLANLADDIKEHLKAMKGDACVMDLVEFAKVSTTPR